MLTLILTKNLTNDRYEDTSNFYVIVVVLFDKRNIRYIHVKVFRFFPIKIHTILQSFKLVFIFHIF